MSIVVGPLPWRIARQPAGPALAPDPEDEDDGIHIVSVTVVERPRGPVLLVVVSWFEDGRWVEREVEIEGLSPSGRRRTGRDRRSAVHPDGRRQ